MANKMHLAKIWLAHFNILFGMCTLSLSLRVSLARALQWIETDCSLTQCSWLCSWYWMQNCMTNRHSMLPLIGHISDRNFFINENWSRKRINQIMWNAFAFRQEFRRNNKKWLIDQHVFTAVNDHNWTHAQLASHEFPFWLNVWDFN